MVENARWPKADRPGAKGHCPICGTETSATVTAVVIDRRKNVGRGHLASQSVSLCETHAFETWQEVSALLTKRSKSESE